MKRNHSSRGSVLLLVVGLLTMVAMLGATFLIVARMNTRQIKDASVKNFADPVAAGAVSTLSEILKTHLYLGDRGPFGQAFTMDANGNPLYNADSWKMYIDYADSNMDRFLVSGDPVLPYQVYDASGSTPYNLNSVVTPYSNYDSSVATYSVDTCVNFAGSCYKCIKANGPGTADGARPPTNMAYWAWMSQISFFYCISPIPTGSSAPPLNNTQYWGPCPIADTDGDGAADAFLIPTNVVTSTGDRYFTALKVADTCGMFNLNTACSGHNSVLTNPISPANVDLRVGLGNDGTAPIIAPPSIPKSGTPNFADYVLMCRGPQRGTMGFSALTLYETTTFYYNCGQQMLNPTVNGVVTGFGYPNGYPFVPYGVSEEPYLAYYGPIPQLGLLYWDTGVYFAPLGPRVARFDPTYYFGGTSIPNSGTSYETPRSHSTVWNCDRNLIRHPDSDLVSRSLALLPGTPTTSGILTTGANSDGYRQLVYQQALAFLNPLMPDQTTRKYAAASFTANLWYHLDLTLSAESTCWAFTPAGESFTAFAVPRNTLELPRIYLTEAYFKTDGKGAPFTLANNGLTSGPLSVKAVELWVPSSAPGAAALVGTTAPTNAVFWIKFGSGAAIQLSTIPGMPATISAGNFVTVYIQRGGITPATGQDALHNQFVPSVSGTIADCSNVKDLKGGEPDFTNGPIQLLVQLNGTSPLIPVDQIDPSAPGLPPTFAAPATPNYAYGSAYSWDMQKDTNDTDNRYTVAAAATISTNTTDRATHTLGGTNTGVTAGAAGIGIGVATSPNPVAWAKNPVQLPTFQLTGAQYDSNASYNPGCSPNNIVTLASSAAYGAPAYMVSNKTGATITAYMCGVANSAGANAHAPGAGDKDANGRYYWIQTSPIVAPPVSIANTLPPMINTLGDLCDIYFCGPIATTTATPSYYPFSAMISSGGSAGTTNDTKSNPTYFTAAFPITDTVRGRLNFEPSTIVATPPPPAWLATTTYKVYDLVTYQTKVYISLVSANKNRHPDTQVTYWSQQIGWSKNPTPTTTTLVTGYYPDVPHACLLGEFFDCLQPDPTRSDEWRHYGRINVNTATRDVLSALPWPNIIGPPSSPILSNAATIQAAAVEFILAYRDQRVATSGTYTKDYTNRATASGINGLRTFGNFNGYLTPAEVAIPLADLTTLIYGASMINGSSLQQQPNFFWRDQLYRSISNLITVRSDTFRANVYVELRDSTGTRTRQNWRYVTIIDRSNCRKASDRPAILLFTEIR